MEQSKIFTHFIMLVVVSMAFLCLGVQNPLQAYESGKLSLLRQRIQRLETRLAEDITLIREEFYHELSIVSESDSGDPGKTSSEAKDLKKDLEEFVKYISEKLNALQNGLAEEKRFRRNIKDDIRFIKAEDSEIVKAIEFLSQNASAYFEDVLKSLNAKSELLEVISLLKDLESRIAASNSRSSQNNKEVASDCADLYRSGHMTSGIYTVFPKTIWRPLEVYCDMEIDGGGWTVFQRRKDGSEDFERKWLDYSFGFGNLSGEFWLGNEFVHRMTHKVPHELRIELEDFENNHRVAQYGLFSVGNVSENYALSVNFFEGNVTDSLTGSHNGKGFSTTDHGPSKSCSGLYKGGWWYANCHGVNINGLYLRGRTETYADGIVWHGWHGHHYSLKTTEMKIRPK